MFWLSTKFLLIRRGKLKAPYLMDWAYIQANIKGKGIFGKSLDAGLERAKYVPDVRFLFSAHQDNKMLTGLARRYRLCLIVLIFSAAVVVASLVAFAGQILPMITIALIGIGVLLVGLAL